MILLRCALGPALPGGAPPGLPAVLAFVICADLSVRNGHKSYKSTMLHLHTADVCYIINAEQRQHVRGLYAWADLSQEGGENAKVCAGFSGMRRLPDNTGRSRQITAQKLM